MKIIKINHYFYLFVIIRLLEQIKCDREVCSQFLITKCVQIFLEQNEQWVSEFIVEFEQRKLADEKNLHLNRFLATLEIEMKRNNIWKSNTFILMNFEN